MARTSQTTELAEAERRLADAEFLDKMSSKIWRDPKRVLGAVRSTYDICGKTGFKNVGAHKRFHKEV